MADKGKILNGLKRCQEYGNPCEGCPYIHEISCWRKLHDDALALLKEQEEKIESLTEDIEVWKRRYKVMVLECKSSDDPNKEPAIVRYYTTEEVEQGKAVAFPND